MDGSSYKSVLQLNRLTIDSTRPDLGVQGYCRRLLADQVMLLCIVLAVLLHALLIFGLSFIAPSGDRAMMQDVTVAVTPIDQKNPDADFLAQSSQTGSGVLRAAHRMTSPERAQQAAERVQTVAPQMAQSAPNMQAQQAQNRVLVTTLSWRQAPQSVEQKHTRTAQPSPSPEAAQAAMMATLEAQYAKRKQEYSKKTKIHTVDSVSAQADPSASYIEGFRRRVERAGNRHYPDAARAAHLRGDVRLMVILQPDGSVRAIRLLESSGHKVLDKAAKSSVRQGAPYATFGRELSEFSELRIIRTWRFSEQMDAMDVAP